MSDYSELTEEILEIGDNPIYFSLENDDEKYLLWLLENEAKVPKDTLNRILNNGWPSKYVFILLSKRPAKQFTNPLKSAIYAEDNDIIDLLLKKGFSVDENILLAAVDEDNSELLAKLLKRYEGELGNLLDLAMIRGSKNCAVYLKGIGVELNTNKDKEQCEKDEEGNIIDPISAEAILPDRLVTIRERTKDKIKVFCFDLDSLYNYWQASGKYENPINRQKLPDNVIERIRKYALEKLTRVYFRSDLEIYPTELTLERDAELGKILFEINEQINIPDLKGRQNLGNLMLTFEVEGKVSRIFSYDLTTPMNSLNFGKNFVFTVSDLTNDPYINIKHGELYPKIYKYASGKGIEWAENLIPEIYSRDPAPRDIVDGISLGLFTDALVDLSDIVGIKEFVDNERLKIYSQDVEGLEDIVDARFEGSENTYLKHLINSRVVDKENLKAREISRYYIRNVYQQPDYRILYVP